MAAHDSSAPRYMPPLEVLSAEDFETASIRSAAPSYTSEAPSYHSTATHGEPIPPYSPPAVEVSGSATSTSVSASASTGTGASRHHYSAPPTLLPRAAADQQHHPSPRGGLPPIPPLQPRRPSDMPNLGAFRIPSWSTMSSNPTARHYQRVAHRRVAASQASGQAAHLQGIRRMVLDRIDEDERNRFRPLEDPYLVGEEAARRARQERLARENGDDVLVMEDRCWDGFLAELRGWEERERNGKQFRREMESLMSSSSSSSSRGGRFARRFGFR